LRELPRSTSSVSSPKADQLKEGSEYPLDLARGKIYSVLQRDERLIATKRRGEVTFVQRGDKISDTEKRTRLERIQESLRRIYRNGHLISKIFVNEFGHVGYIHEGRAYFLGFAPEGQAGFVFEDS